MRIRSFVLLLATACATAPTPPPAKSAADTAPPRDAAPRVVSVLELRNKLQPRESVDTGYVADRLRAEVLSAGIDAKVISRENMLVLLQSGARDGARCAIVVRLCKRYRTTVGDGAPSR